MAPIKTTEMAKRLGVSDSLIRDWAGKYADYLTPAGAGIADGASRRLSDEDQLVMATISQLRNEGRSHEEILEELGAGWRVPIAPDKADPNEEKFRREMGIVTMDKYRQVIVDNQRLQSELSRVLHERDDALHENKELAEKATLLREQLAELRVKAERVQQTDEQLSAAQAEVLRLTQAIGQYQAGNVELHNQLQYVQYLLEEEKKRKKGLFG